MTNLVLKTTDGDVKLYKDSDYYREEDTLTIIKTDHTIDSFNWSHVYYIREEKEDV